MTSLLIYMSTVLVLLRVIATTEQASKVDVIFFVATTCLNMPSPVETIKERIAASFAKITLLWFLGLVQICSRFVSTSTRLCYANKFFVDASIDKQSSQHQFDHWVVNSPKSCAHPEIACLQL